MTRRKTQSVLLILLISSLITGFVAEFLYHRDFDNITSFEKFSLTLHNQIEKSELILKPFVDNFESIHEDIFFENLIKEQQIAYYLFDYNNLIYWNTNKYQIEQSDLIKDEQWHYIRLSNAHGIHKWTKLKNNLGILTIIPLKSDYPYENQYLTNDFKKPFSLNESVEITPEHSPEYFAVYDQTKTYLFSIYFGENTTNNKLIKDIGFIAFLLAFLLLILLYYNAPTFFHANTLNLRQFHLLSIGIGLILFIGCIWDYPSLFFYNNFSSVHQFASGLLFNSITHLTVICIYLVTAIVLYDCKVIKKTTNTWSLNLIYYLYVYFLFAVIKSIIFDSNINFNIHALKDIGLIKMWSQFLIFWLATGLFFLLHIKRSLTISYTFKQIALRDFVFSILTILIYGLIFEKFIMHFILVIVILLIFDYLHRFRFNNKFDFSAFGVFIFMIGIITLITSYAFNEYKNEMKYKVLSGNILINGNSENDPIAELLLEELDEDIRKDKRLKTLINQPKSEDAINKHIFEQYLSNFWNNYDVRIHLIPKKSVTYDEYINFLQYAGKKIQDTGFYSLPISLYDLTFIGIVDLNPRLSNVEDTDNLIDNILIFEFQPKRNFKSFSFPDLLISEDNNLESQSNISIAKYENSKLIYSDSKYEWPKTDANFSTLAKNDFYKLKVEKKTYYVYTKNNVKILITELAQKNISRLLFYFVFTFLSFLFISRIILWLYHVYTHKTDYVLGLTAKFQLVFVLLLFMSFVSILIFSVEYMRNNYEQEQIVNIENKKQYIQKSLQDLYYWTEDIDAIDDQSLKNNLEELAYRYHTDINVYHNNGKLLASSQSLIFSKQLISNLLSPQIYFNNTSPENLYDEIGTLSYLSAYSDLINGDYLQIGYISIPQYLSETEVNAKIDSFMLSIIQIYLIIIILSIILILISGKQLSEPLRLLENKLKSMRLDGKNERIEYKWKDEIGKLVDQYNKTVDELEKSTTLLLQSERETAWRTMARQVAHEINNPLTPMKLTIQQLQRTKKANDGNFDDYFDKTAKTLIEQIDNLSRIAMTFSQFARMPDMKFVKIDVASKLTSVVTMFKSYHDNINFQYTGPQKQVFVWGDADLLIQVFNNILKNASQAIKHNSTGKINVDLLTFEDEVIITVTDNGSGISNEVQPNIFKPNFTTKTTGMGLGLSISKNIIENMHGNIHFISTLGVGTSFYIKLPKFSQIQKLHKANY